MAPLAGGGFAGWPAFWRAYFYRVPICAAEPWRRVPLRGDERSRNDFRRGISYGPTHATQAAGHRHRNSRFADALRRFLRLAHWTRKHRGCALHRSRFHVGGLWRGHAQISPRSHSGNDCSRGIWTRRLRALLSRDGRNRPARARRWISPRHRGLGARRIGRCGHHLYLCENGAIPGCRQSRHLSGIGPWVRHVEGLACARPHSNPHRSDRPDSRHRRSARYRHSQDCKIMNSKPIKIPGPDHPINITPTKGRVTATVNGKRVADTREALTLKEAAHPPVQYIPRKDVDMTQLQRTGYETYCPYKGECSYYSIPVGGERSVNAVWTYESPFAAVDQIKNHVAFYPTRVEVCPVHAESCSSTIRSTDHPLSVAKSGLM